MGNELESKIVELIDKISDGVGIAAPKVYEVLIKQAYIDAFFSMIVAFILICAFIKLIQITKNKTTERGGCGYMFREWCPDEVWPMVWILGFILGMYAGDVIQEIITIVVNPEYAAIRKIL